MERRGKKEFVSGPQAHGGPSQPTRFTPQSEDRDQAGSDQLRRGQASPAAQHRGTTAETGTSSCTRNLPRVSVGKTSATDYMGLLTGRAS